MAPVKLRFRTNTENALCMRFRNGTYIRVHAVNPSNLYLLGDDQLQSRDDMSWSYEKVLVGWRAFVAAMSSTHFEIAGDVDKCDKQVRVMYRYHRWILFKFDE